MADIIVMPGIERRDLAGEPVPSDDVLTCALAENITDVVVIGRDRRGDLYVAAESNDADRVTGMLMRAIGQLSTSHIVQDEPDTGESV